ncbi:hypothetical protein ACFRQM_09405 [Streptomyces sp. NPDC056831]|uniref:hypothetical protein n=1 Tax=Streptomyces sp. NPDC056831 TaxID=3345954 RepID=UPI0036B54CF1
MDATKKTAHLMARLVEAETTLRDTRREEARTECAATRAIARVQTARTDAATARRDLCTAERTGKGLAAATRRLATRTIKLDTLTAAAREAKATATAARRAARTAARRLDTLGRRAALAATRTVATIAHRLGEASLTPAPTAGRTLAATELPAAEEIQTHADRFTDLDQQAKTLAKQADAEKTWLRALPVGIYGRVVITRTPGGSVLDSDQVALDYTARGEVAPRKARRDTFKVAVQAEMTERATAA